MVRVVVWERSRYRLPKRSEPRSLACAAQSSTARASSNVFQRRMAATTRPPSLGTALLLGMGTILDASMPIEKDCAGQCIVRFPFVQPDLHPSAQLHAL